ncbi:MAG: hypothetical protein LBE80_07805 [Deltaproteobacteria bacterium]|nr:hypothetical protein [Deltaproteobacteria bacterium]
MSQDILDFAYGWSSAILAHKTMLDVYEERIVSKSGLNISFLSKTLDSEHRELKILADYIIKNYLDTSRKPIPNRFKWTHQNPTPNPKGVPSWARLKGLDDPKKMRRIWRKVKRQLSCFKFFRDMIADYCNDDL